MRKHKEFIVVVEWINVFGESYDTEIPCTSEKKMEKLVQQLKNQYKHDPFIQEFKVYPICR